MKKNLILAGFYFLSSLASAQPVPAVGNLNSLNSYLLQSFAAAETKNRATLFHIGIETEEVSDGHLVTAVLEDYPAFSAGINRGDVIVSANGKPFHPVTSFNDEATANRASINNPLTPYYDLTVDRDGNRLEKIVVPVYENLFDSYRNATASSIQEFSAGNKVIGYIRLWALSRSTSDIINFNALMAGLSHCDGLILDLRNATGYLDSAHIDSLLPNPSGTDYFGKSVVIIIDASTSESAAILAQQVERFDRIVTLGSPTAGGLIPELDAPYPYTRTSRGDPQFEAALNRLLGTI